MGILEQLFAKLEAIEAEMTLMRQELVNVKTDDVLLTTEEACELLRVSEKTLRKMRDQGYIKAVHYSGGIVRYSKKQLLKVA